MLNLLNNENIFRRYGLDNGLQQDDRTTMALLKVEKIQNPTDFQITVYSALCVSYIHIYKSIHFQLILTEII